MLARYRFAGRGLVLALVTVPFVLPTVVVGAAFLALLPASLDQTVWAILIAHVYFNLAVVIRTVGTLWGQLDPRVEEAARTLGASPRQVMLRVTLPLLRPALLAAASITFLFTFTSFGDHPDPRRPPPPDDRGRGLAPHHPGLRAAGRGRARPSCSSSP